MLLPQQPHPVAMKTIYYDVRRRGGLAATYELLRDGHTSHQLTTAVRRGDVIRVRQGHYACPELSTPEIRASRVGGRLTGLAGARHYGIWAPATGILEVTVHPNARSLRSPTDKTVRLSTLARPRVQVSWSDKGAIGTRSVTSPLLCLREIVRTKSPLVAFAAVESALFQGLVSQSRWTRELAETPRRRRGQLSASNRNSESGGESLMKYHLIVDHIPFEQQRQIDRVGRVDFLVGAKLVVEVDGARFHNNPHAFEEDRRRDAVLSSLGYRVLRFSYLQVERRWEEVSAAIHAALSRGDHLS